MRKAYSAPKIEFESFASSTNIAGDCERIVGNPSKGSCGIVGSSGETLFSTAVSGCGLDWASLNGDNYDGFCYHVPTTESNLFNS